jgi:hypothetical protein
VADQYDKMTTADLEAEAARRTPPVDLTGATTNRARAQALRDDDQRTGQPPPPPADAEAPAGPDPDQPTPGPAGPATPPPVVAVPPQPPPDQPGEVGGHQHPGGTATAEGAPQPDRAADPAPYVDEQDLANRLGAASGNPVVTHHPQGDVPDVGGHQDD